MKALVFKFILFSFATCLSLLFCELTVALLFPQNRGPRILEYDNELGRQTRPNIDGISDFPGIYKYSVKHDGIGCRVPVAEYYKSDENVIVFLGDSVTWGLGVDEKDSFVGLLRGNLNNMFEIKNASMPGSGTNHSLALYEQKLSKFKPSKVILGVYIANDLSDVLHEDFYVPTNDRSGLRYLQKDRDPRPNWKKKIHESPLYQWLGEHSHLCVMLRTYISQGAGSDFVIPADVKAEGGNRKVDELEDETRQGLDIVKLAIRQLKIACAQSDSELILLFLPHQFEIINSAAVHWRIPKLELTELASELGIKAIDTLPAFKTVFEVFDINDQYDHPAFDRYFIKNDGHLTEEGHQLVYDSLKGVFEL